jgi:hypothetical protein
MRRGFIGDEMNNEDAAGARLYRRYAREVRAISVAVGDPGIRSAMLWIARDYQVMAISRLRIGKLNRAMRSINADSPDFRRPPKRR